MFLRWIALVCSLMVLGACSGSGEPTGSPSPSETAESGTPVPPPEPTPTPAPRTGQCYRLGLEAAAAPTADATAVPCRKRHTARTFHVGRLTLVQAGHRLAVDSLAAQAQPRRQCTTRLADHLGTSTRDLRLSMAQAVWFTPTVDEAALGADWFRCDVVVLARPGKLAPLPRQTRGSQALQGFGLCATHQPGARDFARVACQQPHAWRAVETVDLPGPRFPSPQAVSDVMSDRCRDAARDHSDDALDVAWSEERPTREQWRAGQRYGICWVPARA